MRRSRTVVSYRRAISPMFFEDVPRRVLSVSPAIISAADQLARRRFLLDAAVLGTEDRRLFHPLGARSPAGATWRSARALGVAGSASSGAPGNIPLGIGFRDSSRVAICVRRRMRREVILAKGKGGGGHRPPRKGYWSDVWC